ncbi:MAG: DNA recombination protein RmuC [Rickettsiales bacterium]|nr:DNA recombination protein RmuC [Rickettsiales bacterium]
MTIELVFSILCGFGTTIFFYFFAKFKTQIKQMQNEVNALLLEKQKCQEKINFLQEENVKFDKENQLLKYSEQQIKIEKEQWRQEKEVALSQLSEELMRKNNEQQNQLSLNQQENIKKITENLFKDFEKIITKVSNLDNDVKKSLDENSLIKNALLNPGSAGRTAEITLENILKSSGLKEKADLNSVGDYILQSHFAGFSQSGEAQAKRPDVILFFPNDQIAVIDSKSSPHFLELEIACQNKDYEQEKIILSKIKDSFRKHIESLCKKDYTNFLFEELSSKNRADYKIITVMFLQTEKMLEIIHKIDNDFSRKALEHGIIILTPVGLINFLSQARFVIDRVRQEKNIEDLKIQVRKLLESVALIFKESNELGKSLNKALLSYSKLAKNLNRAVYPAMKNIEELGITSKKLINFKTLQEYENAEELSLEELSTKMEE